MEKSLKIVLTLFLVTILSLFLFNFKKLDLITGYAAKNACSCVLVAGMEPNMVAALDNDFFPVSMAKVVIDPSGKMATATILGMGDRNAVFRKGLGCTLLPEGFDKKQLRKEIPERTRQRVRLPYPYGSLPPVDSIFSDLDYRALDQAVKDAFDREGHQEKQTRAVVVLYKDVLVAERYAEGFHTGSLMQGWSMTKSLTASVLGVLVDRGRMGLREDHLFPEWTDDSRSKITLSDLLRMNSGLKWEENYSEVSDVTRMLFSAVDMSSIQKGKPLVGRPGVSWEYSSGTTNLLSGLMRKNFKTYQHYLDFWYKEFIDRIGMHSMILETDAKGNYVGSSYCWATPRDWAKLGLLYLRKGKWNGEQILNENWVELIRTSSKGSDGTYGGHFWLNTALTYPDVPPDMFSAKGFQGQYLFMIPSKDLVVVRMGLAEDPDFDVNRFLSKIIKALN